jgi:hypothetical protein
VTIGKIIAGLTIIAKYTGKGDFPCAAEHDIFYAGPSDLAMSDEDRAELERLGWFIDKESDSWAAFT